MTPELLDQPMSDAASGKPFLRSIKLDASVFVHELEPGRWVGCVKWQRQEDHHPNARSAALAMVKRHPVVSLDLTARPRRRDRAEALRILNGG